MSTTTATMSSKLPGPLATLAARFHTSDAPSSSPARRSLDQQRRHQHQHQHQATPPARRSTSDVLVSPGQSFSHDAQPQVTRRRASASSSSDDLPPHVKDALFAYQMAQPNPHSLTPGTLLAADICSLPRDAGHVHAALLKAGVLVVAPHQHDNKQSQPQQQQQQQQPEYVPVTTAITAHLPRQIKTLKVGGVKALVKLLFFWEEELQRIRAKEADLDQLRNALTSLRAQRAALEPDSAAQPGQGTASLSPPSPPPLPPSLAESLSEEELAEEKSRLDRMAQEVEFRIRAVVLRTKVPPSQRPIDEDHDELPRYQ